MLKKKKKQTSGAFYSNSPNLFQTHALLVNFASVVT